MIEDKITFEELMKEVENHRGAKYEKERVFTEEQKKFFVACRENNSPVAYEKMSLLWEKAGWGKLSAHTIRRAWVKMHGV